MDNDTTRPETDKTVSELARGKAERAVLGKSPAGSMVRIIVFAAAFVVLFGTIFYFMQQ